MAHHLLDLFLGAVLARVGHRVAAVAIGLDLEQGGPLLASRAVDRLGERPAHGQQVHPVHVAAGDPVGAAALVEVLYRRGAIERRAHAVAIVLDHEDDRQVPEPAHVERLVEGALVDGPVAEEADHDLVGLAQADGVAHARGERQVAADDAVPAEVAARHVVEVHAAALAAADAGGAAPQLRHQRPRVGPAGERVAVVAVGAEEVVVGPQQAHGPDRDGLLADVEMEEAADLALHVDLRAALLETPDEEHAPVQRERLVFRHSLPLSSAPPRRAKLLFYCGLRRASMNAKQGVWGAA